MRLLNAKTHQLEEFPDDCIPPYAILSHRWQADEVIFRELEASPEFTGPRFRKLFDTCAQAFGNGIDYVWADTCCIDKSSSAELSESINSMYEWYRCAEVCYVYLNDVIESSVTENSSFHSSVWFTRGWTLQELIAPAKVQFFNAEWQALGSKVDLKDEISAITRIPVPVLIGALAPQDVSIAQRMSWASHRVTTKVEDIAYSLLKLFDVNMPILYGEKEKAFIRLQEEIMKQSDDQTLFAWKISDSRTYHGLFAKSPAAFADSSDIVPSTSPWNRSPYSVTNKGLSIEVPMLPWAMETYFVALDTQRASVMKRLGIFVTFLPEENQYARVTVDGEGLTEFDANLSSKCEYRRIYVRQVISGRPKPREETMYGFWLRHYPARDTSPGAEFDVTSWTPWDHNGRFVLIPPGRRGTAAIIRYKMKSGRTENLKLGFDSMFNPVVQFGGHRYAQNTFGAPNREDFDVMMGNGWMDPKLEGVYKGSRLSGLDVEDAWLRILVRPEIIEEKRIWVVHIEFAEEAAWHKDAICDGCNLNIFGIRYACRVCPDFDYCMACKEADSEHKDHGFNTIKLARHYGVKCDQCSDTKQTSPTSAPEGIRRSALGLLVRDTMLGLTAYGSSSEDEAESSPPLKAQKITQPAEFSTDTPAHPEEKGSVGSQEPIPPAAASVEKADAPLIGPFRPPRSPSPANDNNIGPQLRSQKSSPFSINRGLLRDMTLPPIPNLDIPPSPPGSPNPVANQKFAHFLSLKRQGVHFNEKLASSSSLRNPSLLTKLMEHAGIDAQAQYSTSLPKDLWDPVTTLPPWGYKEELLKSQQEVRRKIEEKKASGPREAIEFVPGSGGGGGSGDSSRSGTPSNAKVRPSAAERVMAGLSREKTSSPMNTDRDRGKRTADLERRPRRKRSRSR
ncbi:hypothetical protein GX51_01621 [Blastomyces parvus]|uniref:ZZ-type domain-containing protein n=1 Tax=Blastomyces parvus TaxID=2060905 RepID=A0A2B7XFS8_9EURO|nr:hypothetical protein GX51_01621 [Blastomyces parvus]